jgi:phosphohistidine phosphatase
MKFLTLVRHAKSSWETPGQEDHDRVLNERGRRAAPAVAAFLRQTYWCANEGQAALMPAPSKLVSSTAQRAWETARALAATTAGGEQALLLDSRLYLAQPGAILDVVRGLDEAWQHVVLVGHNPGLHEFSNQILARGVISRMPTCSVVIVALPTEFWGLADWGTGQLLGHVTPKSLEKRFPELYQGISLADGDD